MAKMNSDVIPCRRHRQAGVFAIRIWAFGPLKTYWFCKVCGTRCVEMSRATSRLMKEATGRA